MADRFDKFTDRARRALQVAQEEAVRLGHAQIGAEHLLLGLLADPTSVAAQTLAQLKIDLGSLAAQATAPSLSLELPQSEIGLAASARQAIELAVEEARALDHHYVGTEHLLLGLLRQESNPAAEACRSAGISLARARAAIVAILNTPPSRVTTVQPTPEATEHLFAQMERRLADPTDADIEVAGQLSDDALAVLGFGVEEARRLNHNYIGTEHMLLGLLRAPETSVARLLAELGVDLDKVRDAVELIIGRGDRPSASRASPRAHAESFCSALTRRRASAIPPWAPEHLLLGIVREGEGIANGVLESLLINPDKIRAQVMESLGHPPRSRHRGRCGRIV